MAQMEKELFKRYHFIAKRVTITNEIDNLDQIAIREIIHDVLNKISYTKKRKVRY
jgi:hypothetical protein